MIMMKLKFKVSPEMERNYTIDICMCTLYHYFANSLPDRTPMNSYSNVFLPRKSPPSTLYLSSFEHTHYF